MYLQTVCTKNNASVEWSYFAQKCITNCTCSHLPGENFSNLRFEKFSRGRNPRPLLTGEEKETGGEGIKVFLPVKKRKEGKGVEGEGPVVGGILLQDLRR